ncbi:MAG: CCA tRNA nucleotidyltransferase [Phycisphaerae bacterium]|nr:CCA tRNA nucleotidyltransferase [Phycisphaerae bacterium]
MSSDRPRLSLRDAARSVAARLTSAGFVAYFAGGCVRDRLLGIDPGDIDIATSATPDDVRKAFPAARGVGESFGVMLVRHGGHMFEVATFRSDGSYEDGRRPSSVRFASAEADAARRDFTVNGLFEEPETGDVVDFVGGRADLDARVLRAIGDPEARFAEDHLRLLRAIRFASRFGLVLDPSTALAMHRSAPRLALIARERIGGEVRRMLETPARARAVALIEEFGLDGIALGEPHRDSAGARLLFPPPEVDFGWGLAAWLLDREGPRPDANVPELRLTAVRDALSLSNREEGAVRDVLAVRLGLAEFPALPLHTRKRLAARPGFLGACWLLRAEHSPVAELIDDWIQTVADGDIAPTPWVTGDDLHRFGLTPGPAFRDVLDATYDAQLDGVVATEGDALTFAERLVRSRRKA